MGVDFLPFVFWGGMLFCTALITVNFSGMLGLIYFLTIIILATLNVGR